MKFRAIGVAFLAVACVAFANADKWPTAPAGSVVAVTRLGPAPTKTTNGRGYASIIINPTSANGTVYVTLMGSMTAVTMAHIHSTSPSGIRLGLLPRTTSVAQLDPAQSYKGQLSFEVAFDNARLQAWGSSIADFTTKLAAGQLYINVHTKANPSGEVQGFFECKAPCGGSA